MTAVATEIREAMASALLVIPGLQVSAFMLSNPTPPSAHVERGDVLYDQAMQQGVHVWPFRIKAFVALLSDIGAATLLDTFLSPTGARSVKAAIEADPTLGGVVSDLHVTGATGEQVFVREQGGPVLGSEWSVMVWL